MDIYVTDSLKVGEILAQIFKAPFNTALGFYKNPDTTIIIIEKDLFGIGLNAGYRYLEIEEDIKYIFTITNKNYHKLKKLQNILNSNNINLIINCCESNATGQFNFDMLREVNKKIFDNKVIKRLWLTKETTKEIQKGLKTLEDNDKFHNISAGLVAELIVDKIWEVKRNKINNQGIELNFKELFVLKLIHDKEQHINKQEISSYYKINIRYGDYTGYWCNKRNNDKLNSYKDVQKVMEQIKNKNIFILTAEEKINEKEHPLLYNLSDIIKETQQYTKTQNITEITQQLDALYKEGYITNPHTNSRHLPFNYGSELKGILLSIETMPQYKKYIDFIGVLIGKIVVGKRVLNENFVDNTHAIIPTTKPGLTINLDSLKYEIYDLIVKRFLTVFMGTAKIQTLKISGLFDDDNFIKMEQSKEIKKGWTIIEDTSEDVYDYIKKQKNSPTRILDNQFSTGDLIDYEQLEIRVINNSSRISSDYSIPNILKLMETGGKNIRNYSNRNIKNRHRGIGRAEDRINVIDGLLKKGLIELIEDRLTLTETGNMLLEQVPDELKSLKLIKILNDKIVEVTQGHSNIDSMITEHLKLFNKILENKKAVRKLSYINYSKIIKEHNCPLCGAQLTEKEKFIGCKGYPSCTLLIPKIIAKLPLIEEHITTLLTDKQTDVIEGFVFKKNPNGRTALKINSEGKVEFDFSKNKKRP